MKNVSEGKGTTVQQIHEYWVINCWKMHREVLLKDPDLNE